jgi:hypothetical protein
MSENCVGCILGPVCGLLLWCFKFWSLTSITVNSEKVGLTMAIKMGNVRECERATERGISASMA